jgi:hypothetical protein
MFFEGNDLADLNREYEALWRWRLTGQREYREFTAQSSFIRAVDNVLLDALRPVRVPKYVEAYFPSAHGEVPLTLTYTPPSRRDIPEVQEAQLKYFLDEYAKFGTDHGVSVSLAFVPCKIRALHGQLRFSPDAPERVQNWQPTDLPEFIASLAAVRDIAFIDLTPVLNEAARVHLTLPYNSIFDSHFNAFGSRVVADRLAAALRGQVQSD